MSNYKGKFRPGAENDNWNMAYELINLNSRVLDVGCSNGNFGEALAYFKKCYVDGVEPDKSDADIASKKLSKVYNTSIEDALEEMRKNNIKYDHIVFLDVIEHLYRPKEVLEKIKSLLTKDGTIVFSIPNMGHQSVRIMLLGGDFEYGKTGILDNTHMHFYTEKEINRVFNEASYNIEKLKGVSVAYNEEVLRSELKAVGVSSPTKDLMDTLSSKNAHIYQYIGCAKPAKNTQYKNINRKFQSPEAKKIINEKYEKKIKQLEAEVYEAKTEAKKNNSRSTELAQINSVLKNEIKGVYRSYTFRTGRIATMPFRLAKQSIRPVINSAKFYIRNLRLNNHIEDLYNLNGRRTKLKIKVDFVIRSNIHPTSSAFIRLISPFTSGPLKGRTNTKLIDGEKLKLRRGVEVVVVQRTAIPTLSDAQSLLDHVRKYNAKLFVDTDDAFGELNPTHPQYELQSKRVEALDYVIKNADEVWFSTEKLRDLYDIDNSKVIKNTLDPRIWTRLNDESVRTINKNKPLKMIYMGTATHNEDFGLILPVLNRLHDKYKNEFELHIVGVADKIENCSWVVRHKPDSALYPDFVKWFNNLEQYDIGLSPLLDSPFNTNKSDIKCLDYLACGIKPVVSDSLPYKNKKLDRLIIRVNNSEEDWYKALEKEINNKNHNRRNRKKTLKKGLEYILNERTPDVAARDIHDSLNN